MCVDAMYDSCSKDKVIAVIGNYARCKIIKQSFIYSYLCIIFAKHFVL